jgi:hypothetical protein
MPAFKDEDAPVIIGNQNAGEVHHTLAHFRNGAKNEYSAMILGCEQDAVDMWHDAKAHGLKYWGKLFMVAPHRFLTRSLFLSLVVPMICEAFDVPEKEAKIWEHGLERKDDAAAPVHWHIAFPHFDKSGKVRRTWGNSHLKCERISRELEVLLDEKIQRGRHQKYSILEIQRTNPEAAEKIKAAHPPQAEPTNRTAKRQVEQAAKARGVDLRAIAKRVRAAFHASEDQKSFEAALGLDLKLEVSDHNRNKLAWVIHDQDGFLDTLGRMVPGIKLETITEKLGEPHARQSIEELEPIEPIDIERGADISEVGQYHNAAGVYESVVAGVHGVEILGQGPDGSREDEIFIAEINAADPALFEALRVRAAALGQTALQWALQYFAEKETSAQNYLDGAKHDLPELGVTLQYRRDQAEILREIAATAHTNWVMDAFDDSVSATRKAELKKKRDDAKDALDEWLRVSQPYEDFYKTKCMDHAAKIVAPKVTIAERWKRVVARCRALIGAAPQVLWMSPQVIFGLGLTADLHAKPGARWFVGPPADEDHDDEPPESPGPKFG